MDMGVFLFAQNMLGTRYVAIKICNFKVPSTLDLVSTYKLDVVVFTIIGNSQEYWWVASYHQEVILSTAILCAHVCRTSQNAFQLY
jgi:hypothetical protein